MGKLGLRARMRDNGEGRGLRMAKKATEFAIVSEIPVVGIPRRTRAVADVAN